MSDEPLWRPALLFGFIWGGILLLMGVLNVAALLASDGGGVPRFAGALLVSVWWGWFVGMLIVPSAMVAALLRGLWLRFAAVSIRYADWPAVLIGALAAPLGLLALTSLDDPSVWRSPGDSLLEGVWPMTLINGGTAGFLAHRRMSLRDPRWWMLTLGSVVIGLAAWVLLDARR